MTSKWVNKYLKVDKIPKKVFYDGLYSISESSLFGRTLGCFPFNKKGELVLSFDGNIDIELWKKVYFQFTYKINIDAIEIFDTKLTRVMALQYNDRKYNVSTIAPGLYYLMIKSAGKIVAKKAFIKL